MTDDKKDRYKKNLIALLKVFRDKPNLLANYMIEYEPLKKKFIDKIITSTPLKRISDEYNKTEYIKPFFINLEEMQNYYNNLFESEDKYNEDENSIRDINPILGASTSKEALYIQLRNAINSEDYIKAAKIKDYILSIGIKLDDFSN